MKNIFLLLILITIFNFQCFAQEPFSSLTVENRYKKFKIKSADPLNKFGKSFLRSVAVDGNGLMKDYTAQTGEFLVDADTIPNEDLFNTSSFGLDLSSEIAIPKVKVGFVYYKLGIYTTPEKTKDDGASIVSKRINLPLFVFSRISASNDSSNISSSIDAIDYDGAPLTVRLMPSFSSKIGEENYLYTGLIIDYRGLNTINEMNENSFRSGLYLATGIRYTGSGTAQVNALNEAIPGKWSFTLLLSKFIGSNEVLQDLYEIETDQNSVNAFQAFFQFKVAETADQSVNLRASYQYSFDKFNNADPSVFKLSLGLN